MQDPIRDFEHRCRERGIPVTVQRRAVFEELLRSSAHPTAERIQRGVEARMPGISPTTVYRVLELLVDLGLARKTCSPGTSCRYDARMDRHHHLMCSSCERILDYDDPALNRLPLPDRGSTGFELEDYTIQFRGTCPECLGTRPSAGGDPEPTDDPSGWEDS
jgi:Fur family peroxide stress response transcriptional regulator